MLGRSFYLKGTVVEGRKLGRTLGLPTANIIPDADQVVPKWGVYETVCEIDGVAYPSVTNIGDNPTVHGGLLSVETHIVGFTGDLYGRELKVDFRSMLRGEIRFDSIDDLKAQIENDIERVVGSGTAGSGCGKIR
jgi:riboflavin kinase/FMN adenylyltransferase